MTLVRSKVAHIQPGVHSYREEGEQFEHDGKPYKHVEVVKQSRASKEAAEDDSEGETSLVEKKSIR